MEFPHSTVTTRKNKPRPTVRNCQAQLTTTCREQNGAIPESRARYSRTRYCAACSYRLKLDRNAAAKRRKRQELASHPASEKRSTDLVNKASRRKYMRVYRAFELQWTRGRFSHFEGTKRELRATFMKQKLARGNLAGQSQIQISS